MSLVAVDELDEVRAFNRFYTRQIRLLDEHLPDCPLALPDARVVYELAAGGNMTAAEIGRRLDMDKAHLSRIVARLRDQGLLDSRVDPQHAKQRLLSLTEAGRAAYAQAESGTRAQLDRLLGPLDGAARRRLLESMRAITGLMGPEEHRPAVEPIRLRGLQPGDIGWIIHRQTRLYHEEYGWDWTYEALAAEILSRFITNFDPAREDGWVAVQDQPGQGERIVGSVFLMAGDEPEVAKLRLLHVESEARGLGIGRMLVTACIDRAHALGYRTLTLWTNDVLVAARRLYQAAGFRLVAQNAHHSFGKDLMGQTWVLDLTAGAPN